MATVLESLGDYIDTNTSLTLGTNLFLARMPDTNALVVALYEYQGSPVSEVMGSSGYVVDRPRVQVMVRGTRDDYPTARDVAQTIRESLALITDQTISGIRVLRVTSIGSVNALGYDENDRPLVSANFEVAVAV